MQKKMQKRWLFTSAWIVCLVLLTATCFAAHGEKRTPKKAILLAAFGTTVPEAQKAFDQIEAQVKQAFPGIEVRWAYTSSIVRAKLAKQGKVLLLPNPPWQSSWRTATHRWPCFPYRLFRERNFTG